MKPGYFLTLCVMCVFLLPGCESDIEHQPPATAQIEVFSAGARPVGGSSTSLPTAPATSSPGSQETPPSPGGGTMVFSDPLSNGTSVGTVVGGEFRNNGYYIPTHWGAYIAYNSGLTNGIRVEFDAQGYAPLEADGEGGKIVMFEMHDGPIGLDWSGASTAWNTNSLFQFVKRGTYQGEVLHMTDGIRLKCGGPGRIHEYATYDGHSPAGHPIAWDPGTIYHWSFSVLNDHVTVIRNDQVMFDVDCPGVISGNPMLLSIGTTGSAYSSVADVTYSNVAVYRLQ